MASIVIENLAKNFPGGKGRSISAVTALNLTLTDGEWLALVGPSGCGKTTLLRLVAGLEVPDAGNIAMDGRDLRGVPPPERDVAMVFQHHALYPHMTVRENLGFGLRLRRVPSAEAERRVTEMAGRLGLQECLERRPAQLSGGQCQRVALGRALVRRPRVLLLDEPFSHLDAPLRQQLRELVKELHRELGLTVLHVTHDQSEALAAGGRVAVMAGGTLHQVGTAAEVYRAPASLVVAQFLGAPPMNLLRGRLRQCGAGVCFAVRAEAAPADTGELLLQLSPAQESQLTPACGTELVVGIRAEQLLLDEPASDGAVRQSFEACVSEVESFGWHSRIGLKLGGVRLFAVSAAAVVPGVGDKVTVFVRRESAVFFDAATGRRLA